MPEYNVNELERLIDGDLPWTRVQEIMKSPKDAERFEKWVQIMQSRVSWPERILLPLTPHLYIVEKPGERVVKCTCGHEFGDYRVNWKLSSLVHVRETEEALGAIYRGSEMPEASWVQIREYYCPGCGNQLEVEAVPRGCPPDFEFLPDLDTFYGEWLGKPLAEKQEFVDKTIDAVRSWPA